MISFVTVELNLFRDCIVQVNAAQATSTHATQSLEVKDAHDAFAKEIAQWSPRLEGLERQRLEEREAVEVRTEAAEGQTSMLMASYTVLIIVDLTGCVGLCSAGSTDAGTGGGEDHSPAGA